MLLDVAESEGFRGEFRQWVGSAADWRIDHGKLILLIPSADWRKTPDSLAIWTTGDVSCIDSNQ